MWPACRFPQHLGQLHSPCGCSTNLRLGMLGNGKMWWGCVLTKSSITWAITSWSWQSWGPPNQHPVLRCPSTSAGLQDAAMAAWKEKRKGWRPEIFCQRFGGLAWNQLTWTWELGSPIHQPPTLNIFTQGAWTGVVSVHHSLQHPNMQRLESVHTTPGEEKKVRRPPLAALPVLGGAVCWLWAGSHLLCIRAFGSITGFGWWPKN